MMKIYTQGQSSLRYGVKNATLLCNYCSVCVYVWQNKRKMILQLGKNCQPLCLVTVSAIKMRTYTQDEAKALTNSWLTKQALHPPPLLTPPSWWNGWNAKEMLTKAMKIWFYYRNFDWLHSQNAIERAEVQAMPGQNLVDHPLTDTR